MIRLIAIATLLLANTTASAQAPISAKVVSCYDGDTCILDREILPAR